MNELDYMIRKLWCLVVDIEMLDFSNTPKKTWWEVKQLKDLVNKKEKLLKEIIEDIKKTIENLILIVIKKAQSIVKCSGLIFYWLKLLLLLRFINK